MELKEKRIVHRFIRDIADYEIGGEYYNQVIPLDTQAFAIYPEHTDKKGIWYVFGDGIHTYIELRDGLGNKESANEFPVFTDADIALIQSKADNAKVNELFAQFDTKKANKVDVYTQTELNNKFAEVNAAINSEEEARTAADEQLQTNIDTKANKADVYTKTEVDAKVSSVYRFKGNVAKVADLPTEGNVVGDVYNVSSTGSNYAWDGTKWDKLSETLDLTPYLLREDAEDTYETISNVNTLNETLNQKIEQEVLRATAAEGSVLESAKEYTDTVAATKANVTDVYNKDEIDTKVSDINTSIANESTARIEADNILWSALELKANKSDVYTKAETDNRVDIEKTARENADAALQTQVTTLEASKADKSDVFSKNEATDIFYQKQKWIDETLGIKSAEEFAVKNAFTGDIAGEQETFSGAINVLDNAITENRAVLAEKADSADVFSKNEATNIFYQKQAWIDSTLGIKSAEENAVKNAFTGEIAGEESTFSGAVNALDTAIVDNRTNLDTRATNIDLNSLLNRLNALEDKVLDLQAANQTEATVDTGAIVVPEGATDVKVSGTVSNPVAISEPSTVTAETLSINHMDATSTTDNLACFVLNSDEVTINNTTFSGEYISSTEKSKNMLYVKNTEIAEEASVVMKNTTITGESLGYNCILIDHTNLKSVTIDNVDFLGTLNNNAISVFEINDNGVINISNCDFNVVSNVFRFSNRGNKKNIVINISNCTCNQWESYADYAGIICLQDYTSKTIDEAVSANRFAPDKITINISNFVYNGVRMTKNDIANVCYVFRDIENKTDSSKGNYRYSEDNLYMFPTINII